MTSKISSIAIPIAVAIASIFMVIYGRDNSGAGVYIIFGIGALIWTTIDAAIYRYSNAGWVFISMILLYVFWPALFLYYLIKRTNYVYGKEKATSNVNDAINQA